MEGLDSKKLFDIFDKYPLDEMEENLISYKSSFRFKIEMFIKIVMYGNQWKTQVVSLFDKSNVDLDTGEINDVGDFMLYTRAWYWVDQFDINDDEFLSSLNELNDSSLLASLLRSINYFEGKEEYEKCAFLVSIKGLLK